MTLFRKLLLEARDAARVPVALAKDAMTLGNVTEDETFTGRELRRLREEQAAADALEHDRAIELEAERRRGRS